MCTGLAFKGPKYYIRCVDFDTWISDSDNHNSVCIGHNMPENPRGIVKLYIYKTIVIKKYLTQWN